MAGSPVDLSAYVDGELGLWRRLAVRLHLHRCEPCRRYVAQLREVRALIAELRGPSAP